MATGVPLEPVPVPLATLHALTHRPLFANRSSSRSSRRCAASPAPARTCPHLPTQPSDFFLACAQIKVRDVSVWPLQPATRPRLPRLPHPAADVCSCRTPPSPSRRPTTRRGTTCAPSSWPSPRAASRRAWRPSSPVRAPRPPAAPAAPATDPCALALQSRGRREPGRAQGGLSAGGAGHRARHRSRGAHVFRCADRRTASARARPQPNPTQPALTRHPLPYPASVDVSYNVRRLPPVEPRRTPSRTHPLTRRPFARGSSSRTRHASASNGRALWCGSEVRSGAVCACGSSCSSLG